MLNNVGMISGNSYEMGFMFRNLGIFWNIEPLMDRSDSHIEYSILKINCRLIFLERLGSLNNFITKKGYPALGLPVLTGG
jgi:hypothetical protein